MWERKGLINSNKYFFPKKGFKRYLFTRFLIQIRLRFGIIYSINIQIRLKFINNTNFILTITPNKYYYEYTKSNLSLEYNSNNAQ